MPHHPGAVNRWSPEAQDRDPIRLFDDSIISPVKDKNRDKRWPVRARHTRGRWISAGECTICRRTLMYYTLNPKQPQSPHPKPKTTQRPAPKTQNPNLKPKTQNPNLKPKTQKPAPKTKNPKPETKNPKPHTLIAAGAPPVPGLPCASFRGAVRATPARAHRLPWARSPPAHPPRRPLQPLPSPPSPMTPLASAFLAIFHHGALNASGH